ncbi:putative 50S ribosomal protein L14e [Monocercomonoides exilis]|uniref:putative 50S ribosomal protein L14e n=1 Tax=Monocercomonoides exilis TaxID=2049356 RepID=UPI003559387E|nr:putative 50S ribosomal protein L14e [Monocercomonoides exilis]|eukprot:MONOS_7150.1-p1 / transcript=MONOS_7150.1 / gene=MONOS_7150 / organism=Monocercomonoides_exilis_PA203 / gene_product=50S ribosomal protein L14e / transcript_product=50S ribosomal protein L14e / location=Mono_scaffold00238:10792-11503(+) / protein_length=167 / sequence_SO=supercontig / SO=protein_coding / is_pseudo=false
MRDRFVQVGRVCILNYGRRQRLCTIVDIIDQNKVLIDGPKAMTGISRQVCSLKRLALTPYTVKIPHGIHHKYLVKKFKKARILRRFARTAWAKKINKRQHKLHESDFDRYKAMKIHRASFFGPHVPTIPGKEKPENKDKPEKKVKRVKKVKKVIKAKKAEGAKPKA